MADPGRAPAPGRWAQVPRRQDALRFLGQMRSPLRATALRAVVDGMFVTVMLKRRGVRPLLRAGAPRGLLDPDRSRRVASAVDAGLALVPVAPTCLRRSVTLIRELGRLGLEGELRIGVRREAGRFEAHAWVQAGDAVVNDDPEVTSTYVELATGDLERVLPHLG